MTAMQAFHNDPSIKTKYLERVATHRRLDQLHQGVGWESKSEVIRGCAVGCTLDAYDHTRYPIELGIPVELAHLEDRLFELQAAGGAQVWPERFLSAIPVGADLSRVWPEWAVWMLVDPTHGVIRHAGDRADVRAAIERIAELWRRGGTPQEFAAADAAAADAAAAAGARQVWVTAACDKLIELLSAAGAK